MQRRRLLQLGIGSAVLLGVAGGLAALWTPGLQAGKLTAAGRQAIGALSGALLDGMLPAGDAALQAQVDAFEAVVANFPPVVRQELQLLLSLTVNAPGRLGLLGLRRPLHELPKAELQQALEAMRQSGQAMRQQAYFGLRDLINAAHFAQPSSWAAMGYQGPRTLA